MTASADFVSDHSELQKFVGFTADFAARAGLGEKELFALQIIVEELVTNVIDYGGIPAGEPAGRVELSIVDSELRIRITDRGKEYNPLLRQEPDLTVPVEERPIGGLGIHFCRKLTDSQEYERLGDRNALTLKKKLTQ
jgi:anti-sigma regulatory factor (Ser/Thr protein kinase)